jgi:hypothetical protein
VYERDDDRLRLEGHERLKARLAGGEPYAVLRATLAPDHQPVFSDYRPQLWIGQTMESGEHVYWDSMWLVNQRVLQSGDSCTVTMFVLSLPLLTLFRGEHVEFYEGHRKTAEAEVIRIRCPGHFDDNPDPGPLEQPIA